MNKFSVIVPTMWKCDKFPQFVDSLCHSHLIDEIIIINNDGTKTPKHEFHSKIIFIDLPSNIFVNPAWNLGVQFCKNNLICLMNDDIQFDVSVFHFLNDRINEDMGVIGLDITMENLPYQLKEIRTRPHGFGSLMFFHKKSYTKIPRELKFFYGDDWLLHHNIKAGKKNFIIKGLKFSTEMSITAGAFAVHSSREGMIYKSLTEKSKNMAHETQMNFLADVKKYHQSFFKNSRVLEIGSVDINGSPRSLFTNCIYTGVDVAPGRGVDRVGFGHSIDDPSGSYDVVLSTECFEHDQYYQNTFKNMIRLCRKGGLIIFTCATTGRPEHGTNKTTPNDSLTCHIGLGDYYKNLEEKDFREFINFDETFSNYWFGTNQSPADLYFCGIKK